MDELQHIAHLGFLDDDVDRDVDARAGQMRGAAGLLKGLVGKVGGLAACVEAAHAAVDGVCPGGECGGKGSGLRRAPKARVCGWWFDWRLRSYPAFQNAQILKSIVVPSRQAMPVL